jgi:transcriptional regulator with XRE-family HTH domain
MTHDSVEDTTGGEDVERAAVNLAEEIRRRRLAVDLSHIRLAVKIGYSREYVRRAENPRKGLPSADLVRALDQALDTGGALLDLREKADAARRALRRARTSTLVAGMPIPIPARSAGVPGLTLDSGSSDDEVAVLAPAGRFFAGTSIAARVFPASDDGRILAAVPPVSPTRCSCVGPGVGWSSA